MATLVFKPGQRRHLFAVRRLVPDPTNPDAYIAGALIAVYASASSDDVMLQVRRDDLIPAPYAVVHVTGYMLALAHQGQEGFRVWVIEPSGDVNEQYVVSLVDMVRAGWSVRKTR